METLFEEIAKEHSVPAAQIAGSLGRNRALIDMAVNLPFVLLYCFAVTAAVRVLWRRYPPAENGWIPGTAMALFLSLVFAVGCTMFGELWSWAAETYRIGNDHMSYRAQRLPWARYRTTLCAGALIVFWLAAAAGAWRMKLHSSMGAYRNH
jgi:hypothetical protein